MNEARIGQLVDRFYAKVRKDNMLGPIFEEAIGDGWSSHLATMRSFCSTVILGLVSYKGNPMAVHLGGVCWPGYNRVADVALAHLRRRTLIIVAH